MAHWRSLYRLRKRVKMEQLANKSQRWFSSPDAPTIPLDTAITVYPTYTYADTARDSQYVTRLRMCVAAPGNANSRRNKIIMSLCRQYLREQAPASQITQTRMQGFLARSVTSRVILDLLGGSATNNTLSVLETQFADTDSRGMLECALRTPQIPQQSRITLDTPPSFPSLVTTLQPTHYIKPRGVGLISDIDDTIKHTGVTGDKKSMFRNVFATPWQEWVVAGLPQWYNSLALDHAVDFFYVSNSPLQLYDTLQAYIDRTLPRGPIFLKQYSGNMLASIVKSPGASNSKTRAIERILDDFPAKRFVLVGDAGERDFETYIDLALRYPDQVAAIYIRCCKDSISDGSRSDDAVLDELNEIIATEYTRPFEAAAASASPSSSRKVSPSPPPVPPRSTRGPPVVPPKPQIALSQTQTDGIRDSRVMVRNRVPPPPPPPLPRRPTDASDTSSIATSSTRSTAATSRTDSEVYMIPSSQDDYNTYDVYFDKNAESWRQRLRDGLRQLNYLPTFNIRIKFFIDPRPCMLDCDDLVRGIKEGGV